MPRRFLQTTVIEPTIEFNTAEEFTDFLDQFQQGVDYRHYVREMRLSGKLLISARTLETSKMIKTTSVWATENDFLAFSSTDIVNRYQGLISSNLRWKTTVTEYRLYDYVR